MSSVAGLKVRLAVRHLWASRPRRLAALRGFQATEADGVWHLLRGLDAIQDPRLRAAVFAHSLEEEAHADAFAAVVQDESAATQAPVVYERQPLYGDAEPAWKRFAYVHVGEVDATAKLRDVQRALEDGVLRRALDKVVRDEEGHVGGTRDILFALGATEAQVRREVRRVRWRRYLEAWLRLGRSLVDRVATVQLSLLYYALGPLVARAARRKLESRTVEVDNGFLKQAAGATPRPEPEGAARRVVLGIAYGYHDASACLVVGGKVVAAAAEERLTRQKHDANFPSFAVQHCLRAAGLSAADVDQVVYHEDPHAKFARVLTAALAPFPASRQEFVNAIKSWVGKKLWSLQSIVLRLGIPPQRLSYLSHHFSHAAQAFLGSGQERAAVLVVDAVGDWASTAAYSAAWQDGRPQLERRLEVAFPHSLGLVYSAVTAYLGFNPNDSECSTMALAAFGQPRFAPELRRIVGELEGGAFAVDQSFFNFVRFYKGPVTERFVAAFGPARDPRHKVPFSCFDAAPAADAEAQRLADVAASVQLVLEERLLQLARWLHAAAPADTLCYAGGVSLNCRANYRLLSEGPFAGIFIPPDPGDGGASVGAALWWAAQQGGLTPEALAYGPFVGAAYDETADAAMAVHLRRAQVEPYLKEAARTPDWSSWQSRRYELGELCVEVAARLADGQIVGWCQGGFELGPRALGNRSILARPDRLDVAARLSHAVKERAAFRPYAVSVSAEGAADLVDVPAPHLELLRWMQFAVPVRAAARPAVAGALHVDGTTRLQACSPAANPRFHRLLGAAGARLGRPALLNTSFNARGYPIVATPSEALVMFARTSMDAVVLNDTLVWKVP